MQLYTRVVKEVEQSPEGPHIGAFFDFDGTIIYGYSATKFLREQIKRGDVKYKQLPELVATMTKFSLGSMDFSAMMTETSGYLKGISESDYVAFGAFYPTVTKTNTTLAEPDILTWCQMFLTLPCVAIGGITLENAAPLVSAGADFLAVSSGVWDHNDGPAAAVAMFNRVIDEAMSVSKI